MDTERDPYDHNWKLLGVMDSRRTTAQTHDIEFLSSGSFPPVYHSLILELINRAFNVIADKTKLGSLIQDAAMLDDLQNTNRAELSQYNVNSITSEFLSLQNIKLVRDAKLHWPDHLATKALLSLDLCSYFYIYNPFETADAIIEVKGKKHEIDVANTEIVALISEVSEFLTLAEHWSGQIESLVNRPLNESTYKAGLSESRRRAANARHRPIKQLKDELYTFYVKNIYPTYVGAVRSFLDQLPPDKLALLSDGNAERTLAEYLGKRVKMEANR